MFTLFIRYLMGWAAATDLSKRKPPEEPEWPLHPGRVFMALAAAHFETPWDDAHERERGFLEWFEVQAAPEILAPRGGPRVPVTCYVPVNDQQGLEALPTRRSKQARTFPRVILDDDTLRMVWRDVIVPDHFHSVLADLCGKVTRIGHSSSVVHVWCDFGQEDEENALLADASITRWIQTGEEGRKLRVASRGTLANLRRWYNEDKIDAWEGLQTQLALAKGKDRQKLKKEIDERFGGRQPRSQSPVLRSVQGYKCVVDAPTSVIHSTIFDDKLLVLAKSGGPNLGLESTIQLMTALRGTILSQFANKSEIPAWISGHNQDGTPLKEPHLSLLPLAFVGTEYADGHLLGVALAFPRSLPIHERMPPQFRALFQFDQDGAARFPELKLGRLGEWVIEPETRAFPPQALRSELWTGPSCTWASVTPIVLDRYPKQDRLNQREAWVTEVAQIIALSCRHIGLPDPIEIKVGKNSWHRGVPRANPGQSGFPAFAVRPDRPPRMQVHACLKFANEVQGPILIGTGRYMGYGLCKPICEPDAQQAGDAE